MKQFVDFAEKLIRSGLIDDAHQVFMGFSDANTIWNQAASGLPVLETCLDTIRINSIMYITPKEPYKTIIDYLAETAGTNGIEPQDCETRTFLHDIPVVEKADTSGVINALKNRKGIIIKQQGIITTGSVSMEQAFVTASSICFACFVKFFSDYLAALESKRIPSGYYHAFQKVAPGRRREQSPVVSLMTDIFRSETRLVCAMDEAGKTLVDQHLVDSYFGNISACRHNILLISQTGSSLDKLKDHIDPCPLDGSSCAGITASSELSAHMAIVRHSSVKTVLHGHPKFAVIMSMVCDHGHCDDTVVCHLNCPEERYVCRTKIVPGEVGCGRYGLYKTVPEVLKKDNGVIVYGHGVFTTGTQDFNEPFRALAAIEDDCRDAYFKRVDAVTEIQV